MSSDPTALEGALAQLEQELHHAPLDSAQRARLEQLMAEIRLAIGDDETTTDEDRSLAERLSDAAQDFEGSHPQLTGLVGSVVEALARMGI
jgi:hypothetical protein